MYRLFLCLLLPTASIAFSTGAPDGACPDMVPRHGVDPQPVNTAPYSLQVDGVEANPAQGTNLTLRSSKAFKGFLILAFNEDPSSPVGRFAARGNTPSDQVQGACGKGMTHTATFQATEEIQLQWTADIPYTAPVTDFYVTLVEEKEQFWAKLKMAEVPITQAQTTPEQTTQLAAEGQGTTQEEQMATTQEEQMATTQEEQMATTQEEQMATTQEPAIQTEQGTEEPTITGAESAAEDLGSTTEAAGGSMNTEEPGDISETTIGSDVTTEDNMETTTQDIVTEASTTEKAVDESMPVPARPGASDSHDGHGHEGHDHDHDAKAGKSEGDSGSSIPLASFVLISALAMASRLI